MKDSRVYQLAQLAIITCDRIETLEKLEALRELYKKEDLARFIEEDLRKENNNGEI